MTMLPPTDIDEIRDRYQRGESTRRLAAAYGVAQSTIHRHVKDLDGGSRPGPRTAWYWLTEAGWAKARELEAS